MSLAWGLTCNVLIDSRCLHTVLYKDHSLWPINVSNLLYGSRPEPHDVRARIINDSYNMFYTSHTPRVIKTFSWLLWYTRSAIIGEMKGRNTEFWETLKKFDLIHGHMHCEWYRSLSTLTKIQEYVTSTALAWRDHSPVRLIIYPWQEGPIFFIYPSTRKTWKCAGAERGGDISLKSCVFFNRSSHIQQPISRDIKSLLFPPPQTSTFQNKKIKWSAPRGPAMRCFPFFISYKWPYMGFSGIVDV